MTATWTVEARVTVTFEREDLDVELTVVAPDGRSFTLGLDPLHAFNPTSGTTMA